MVAVQIAIVVFAVQLRVSVALTFPPLGVAVSHQGALLTGSHGMQKRSRCCLVRFPLELAWRPYPAKLFLPYYRVLARDRHN